MQQTGVMHKAFLWVILWMVGWWGALGLGAVFGAAVIREIAVISGWGVVWWAAGRPRYGWVALGTVVGGWGVSAFDGGAFRLLIVDPLISVALLFWLGERTSTLPTMWLAANVRLGLVYSAISGGLMWVGIGAGWVNPLMWIMVGSMGYKLVALANGWQTLARHWMALTLLLYFLALGLPGALSMGLGGAYSATLRLMLGAAPLLVILGAANQIAAERRGINRRVTGLLPFWCVSLGLFGALLGRYSIDLLAAHDVSAVEGFIRLETVGFGAGAVGMVIYGLAWGLRRW